MFLMFNYVIKLTQMVKIKKKIKTQNSPNFKDQKCILSHDFFPFLRNRKLLLNPGQWIINNPFVGLLSKEKKKKRVLL